MLPQRMGGFVFLEDNLDENPNGELGIYTLGAGYDSSIDACFRPNLDKAAKLQDLAYHIKGELLKQSYSPLHSSYKKSTLCGSMIEIVQENGVVIKYMHLCRCKWCPRCARIRTAELINAYVPIIKTWDGLFMVSLTVKNINPYDLKDKLSEMQKRFRNIVRTMHNRLATKEIKIIKSIEISVNSITRTLHPHYHLLLESKEAAIMLQNLWVNRSNKDGEVIVWNAQDVVKATSPEDAAKEMFKYITKFVLLKKTGEIIFDAWMLDKVYQGTYRKHLIQTYGFVKPIDDDNANEEELKIVEHKQSFHAVWEPNVHQYVEFYTKTPVSFHRRSKMFKRILSVIKGDVTGEETNLVLG